MKKMFAIVLALMLCVGVLSVAAFAAEGDLVISIDAPDEWAECYAYNWPGDALGGWPGTKLTKGADGMYKVTVSACDGMVISAGKDKPQTQDITGLDFSKGEAKIVIGEAVDGKHTYTVTYKDGTEPEPTPPVVGTDFYVAGTPASLFGTEWDAANPANKMTKGDDGIYYITYKNVPAGKYSLKVTDGTWDNSWGGKGKDGNFDFELTEPSDVTVKFNPETCKVTVLVGDEPITGDVSLAAVSVALLAATAGLVVVVSKKKEF